MSLRAPEDPPVPSRLRLWRGPSDTLHGRWFAGLVALAVVGGWWSGELAAQRTSPPGSQGPLWISESRLDDTRRLLVVVDEVGRHLAIYHVDAAAGTLALKSTRDISWDLSVGDFNAQDPRPGAIQKMLQLPTGRQP
jgi:hypothetical protein